MADNESLTPPNLKPPTDAERRINPDQDELIDKEQLLSRIKLRYEDGVGAWEENRRMHSEDLNFVYNSESMGQWDPVVLEARRGKPCYTFNRVLQPCNIVVADMRQTKPAGKVRPTNQSASEATAEVLGGLVRSIEDESRADPIYKNQYKFAVAGGFGAWRLVPEWAEEDSFDQVLRIKDIPNPQTVIWDPECSDACGADAMWCLIGERISKEKYNSLYPDAEESPVSFHISRDSYGWFTDKEVRVVEYMERIPYEKTIAMLSDGRIIDYTPEEDKLEKELAASTIDGPHKPARVVRKRKVLKWRVMWVKADGGQILEGPIFYDWKRIPVVRVPGRYINIEGRKKFQSLVRHAKDAQRNYNSRVNDMIERSILTPKAPYLVTETMVKGYEDVWSQANTASRPYLPYNVDPKAEAVGGAPQRTPPIDFPQASLALAQSAAQDIQATTGFFDPALGNAEDMNRVSGKALVQHTRRSDLGSFEFMDGFGDALQLTWEMAIDMIPTIYDSARVVRIIGNDGIEKMVNINSADPKSGDIIHDLKVGSYSCKVTIGPAFQTARQETLDTLIDFAEALPQAAPVIADLLAKNLDSPDADELARRLRIPLIHQGIIQPTEQEQQSLPPPPPPNPLQQAELAREQALAKRDAAQALIAQSKAKLAPVEAHKLINETAGKHLENLKTQAELNQMQGEAQTNAISSQMDLAHQAVSHAQDLHHNNMEHHLNLASQLASTRQSLQHGQEDHLMNLAHKHVEHKHELHKTHQEHQEKLAHTKASNKQKREIEKEMGAAKVKATATKPAPKKE